MERTIHTVVEIFDSVILQNNIMATLAFHAKHTIFLLESRQEESLEGVCALLKAKQPELHIDKAPVESREAKRIIQELLGRLYDSGEKVLVEINGGNPIITNYARECCRKFTFPCVAIDASCGEVIGIENGAEWEGSYDFPMLTFNDILLLQGRTYNRHMHMLAEEEYYDRILDMSEYAFSHQSDFKFFYDFVHHKSDGQLSEPGLKIVLSKAKDISDRIIRIFELFENQGFIKNFTIEESRITFTCAAPFVKEMLAVKGSWLEMYVYILAKHSGLFSEVYQSVMIGWDLEKRPKFNVENEIDVVLMKQGIPIFISCKMTNPKPEDLNEIFALAGSFGGYGAIPALATSTDVRNRATTLWNRAQEMGVTLIDHNLLNRDGLLEFFEKI